MITKEDVLKTVAEAWWERSPRIIEFVNHHLTIEGARVFAPEHTYFAAHFPRWFGNVIGNCPVLEARAYMIGNMYVEEVDDPTIHDTHHGSMVTFAEGLGLARAEVLNHTPSIPMLMGVHYWDNISRTRPWLEGFAAIGALELTNHGELAARYGEIPLNSRKKWERLGLDPKYLVHWEAADVADPGEGGHADETVRIIVKYATTPERARAALEAVSESINVFRFIYDQIAERAIAASKKSR
ncbi:MAG TPA: iron-containing redox enzyme family protein [Candidatus Acidoferrales bacterium]|nr:iron-containing redox enzyme family protein [Candidatus Acidoferrales bacterium]